MLLSIRVPKQFIAGLVLSAGSFITSCKDYKPEMEQALMQRDSVMMMSLAKDSSINEFLGTLTTIESNLDSITRSQNAISMDTDGKTEFSQDIRDRIYQNIELINRLLQTNQEMMASLKEKVRKSNYTISSLKDMIEKLNAEMINKDAQIADLNTQLTEMHLVVDGLNLALDSLSRQNMAKEQVISDQTGKLNTAYYTVGTYKDLKARNILSKEGGFLGIGKEQVLKKDFDLDGFTQIDISKTESIDINKKSVKVVTNHPSDSYSLEKDKDIVTKLVIKDQTRFWKASKFLVIVTG
ncbi:MAG TPA: hypothetical protein VFW78_04515 [Bacteroidia bacterium]|nr:hypothetical protein [Bacteroidia bacterium]